MRGRVEGAGVSGCGRGWGPGAGAPVRGGAGGGSGAGLRPRLLHGCVGGRVRDWTAAEVPTQALGSRSGTRLRRLGPAGLPGLTRRPIGIPGSGTGTGTVTGTTRSTPADTSPSPPSPPLLQQLSHDPHEISRIKRLGEEGIDADVEPALHLVLGAGTDDGERKITGTGVGTQLGGGPQPVQPGHDDIEGDDVGPHPMHDIQTLDAIGRGHDLDALQLEVDPDQLPDDLVVVHNKNPAGRAWHNSRVGRATPPRPAFPDFCPVRGAEGLPCGRAALASSPEAPRQAAGEAPAPSPSTSKPVHDHHGGAGSVLPVAASNTNRDRHAPVAQGIEQRPPEPCAQVRILPGAHCASVSKTPPSASSLSAGSCRMCRRLPPEAAVCQ